MPAIPRLPVLLFGLFTGAIAAPWAQDPKPAPTDAPPPATAPGPKPAAPRTPHPLEGVYKLHARMLQGRADGRPTAGYLAITQRHLFVCLAANGVDPEKPLLRAGVRTWQANNDMFDGAVQLGWYTDAAGRIVVEKPNSPERRRIEAIPGGVRVWQDAGNWLDFERIE